ncbi:helix-turn-helix domain-containing protein [Methylophilus glucosoxydans]|uniref:Helix-turn-helix domain-containing protein n=1 Tax=Methylophilus glucosoxydans TaxID=752553 RepID=A0ABW3GJ11_9PROT
MCDLLEKAREAQGGISYYELAKRLGIGTPLMNKWKNNKSQPNGLNTLKLVEMAKLTPEEAIKILEKGSMNLGVIFSVAFISLLLFATCSTELKAAEMLSANSMQVHDSYIHYANKKGRSFAIYQKAKNKVYSP